MYAAGFFRPALQTLVGPVQSTDEARTRRKKPGTLAGLFIVAAVAYCTSTARLSAIFFCQIAGPVMCTDSPLVSTATVTGMSFTSNS